MPPIDSQTPNRSFMTESIRKRFGLQSESEKAEEAVVNRSNTIFNYLSTSRRRAEYEWWLNDQFYLGQQNVRYNTATKRVESVVDRGEHKIIINKIAQNGRNVISYLNREHPTVAILPGIQTDDAYNRAKKEKHLIDYWYDHLQMNKKNKQITLDGYRYKLGWAKILWNKDALAPTAPYTNSAGNQSTKSYGEVMYERVDPFEIYFDPLAKDLGDMRFICHALPRTLSELRNNPAYSNADKLSSDSKLAASYLKEAQIRQQTLGAQQFTPQDKEHGTVIVREMFIREFSKEHNRFIIRVITTTANGVLLRNVIWPMDDFPFEFYLANVQGSLLDGGGPVRDLRSPQRALNQMNTIIHENARLMGKINWKIPRGANVNVITDQVGQFLEFDPTPGGAPEQIQPAGLPNYMELHLDRLERYIDDLGGNHSASYGRSPGSRASGELVNQLQEGDSNNLAMMRDNFDDFMVRVNKKLLATYKANAKTDRYIRLSSTDGIGQHQFISIKPSEISLEDDIQVRTGTNMPYSLSEKQDLFINLWKEKVIQDPKVILKLLELPDVDNIVNTDQLDIERQLAENKALLEGKPVGDPVVAEDHNVHIKVLDQLIKSQEFKDAKPEIQDAILAHRAAHINFSIQLAAISASMNVEPIKRSEAIMYRPNNFNEMTPIERTQIFSKFGIQSDAAQIMQRGGLDVQDPATAEQQAAQEDSQMLDGRPVQIGLSDNHQVHIETHAQIMDTAAWKVLPDVLKKIITDHINQHVLTLKSRASTPGLMPSEGYDLPPQPVLVHPPHGPEPTAKPAGQPSVGQSPAGQPPAGKRPLKPEETLQNGQAVENQLAAEKLKAKPKKPVSKKKP